MKGKEAHDRAIVLAAGVLARRVEIVEERTDGPSFGADNIRQGLQSAVLGL